MRRLSVDDEIVYRLGCRLPGLMLWMKERFAKEFEMRLMNCVSVVSAAGMAVAASAQVSSINSLVVHERVYNDFPTSVLSTSATPSSFHVREDFAAGTVGNYANKHYATFSADGVSDYLFANADSFQISFNVNLDAFAGSPRKEAGLFFANHHPDGWDNEGPFMVASDGESAIFGGGLPFTGFGGGAYTRGTTVAVQFNYFAPSGGGQAAYEAIFNGVSSGVKKFDDPAFNGINDGSKISFYSQNQRNPFVNDFVDLNYTNIKIIPTPASGAIFGLVTLVGLRRRR